MSRRNLANFIIATIWLASVACSGQSPAGPSASTGGVSTGPGSYELAFFKEGASGLEAVSSLPFGVELILGAHIQDSSGRPAQRGTVTFEYCSRIGFPKDDITRVDEAPLEACANGSATWATLVSIAVNQSGEAHMNFGFVRITPLIGFRLRYAGQGSGIADGVSAPRDFSFHLLVANSQLCCGTPLKELAFL